MRVFDSEVEIINHHYVFIGDPNRVRFRVLAGGDYLQLLSYGGATWGMSFNGYGDIRYGDIRRWCTRLPVAESGERIPALDRFWREYITMRVNS